MTMKPSEKLELLVEYYWDSRGAGHTGLMMRGVLGSCGAALVAHTMDYAKQLAHDADGDFEVITSVENLDALLGHHCPLAIDNSALLELFTGILVEVTALNYEIVLLEEDLNEARNVKTERFAHTTRAWGFGREERARS